MPTLEGKGRAYNTKQADNRAADPSRSAEPTLKSLSFEPRFAAAHDTLWVNEEMRPLFIENADKEKLTVILEPWAEEYYLRKKDVLMLQQPSETQAYYRLTVWENGDIQVIIENDIDYPIVKINDKVAEPWKEVE